LLALQEALNEVIDLPNQKQRAIAQIREAQETIDKLKSGSFTFAGLLKDAAGKKDLMATKEALIASLKIDVSNFDAIRNVLVVYLATVAIPMYQKQAKERYVIQMGLMCRSEVHNSASLSACWYSFRQLISSYNIKEDDE
jgi:hypothetical protein